MHPTIWKARIGRIVTAQLAAGDDIATSRTKAVDWTFRKARWVNRAEMERYAATLEA